MGEFHADDYKRPVEQMNGNSAGRQKTQRGGHRKGNRRGEEMQSMPTSRRRNKPENTDSAVGDWHQQGEEKGERIEENEPQEEAPKNAKVESRIYSHHIDHFRLVPVQT